MKAPVVDYLVIGHVSLDITPDGIKPGGTVTFAARTAQALGYRPAVLTSVAQDLELETFLPDIPIRNIPAIETTTFRNTYTDGRRRQEISATAGQIRPAHVPSAWQRAPIVHLGPIVGEIDTSIVTRFSNSLLGVTPQGWYRRWDEQGRVFIEEWPEASSVLPQAAAVIMSLEDLIDPGAADDLRRQTSILVLTEQDGGCTVFCRGEKRHFDAPSVDEVNPTGAGDTFAAAYFIRLHQNRGNPWDAADFANRIAAASVTRETLDEKVEAIIEIVSSR